MGPIDSIDTAEKESDRKTVIKLARRDSRVLQGDLEIDDNAVVSWSADNGAYVQAWLWVDFDRTELDEES